MPFNFVDSRVLLLHPLIVQIVYLGVVMFRGQAHSAGNFATVERHSSNRYDVLLHTVKGFGWLLYLWWVFTRLV